MIDTREEVLARALRGVVRSLREEGRPEWERRHNALTGAMAALNTCGIEIPDAFEFSESEDE